MVVALSKENFLAEKSLQLDALEKEMQKIYATEVSDVLPGEGNFEIFGSEWHRNVTYQKGRFGSTHFSAL